ncbi:MAG: hypothetical protein AAF086_04965 [Planctomycetota bacterium]
MSAIPQPSPPDSSRDGREPDESSSSHAASNHQPEPDAPVLSAEHYAQLAAAHLAFAPVRRALRVVTFSASTLALFAVLSLPFAFFSLKAAFVATALVAAAAFELRGRAAVGRLELAGVSLLVRNQIALTAAMTVYCLWSMASAWFGPDLYAEVATTQPEVGQLLEPYAEMFRQAAIVFYGIVLLAGLVVQAGVIRYYATRRRPIETYLAQTPAWILAWNRP